GRVTTNLFRTRPGLKFVRHGLDHVSDSPARERLLERRLCGGKDLIEHHLNLATNRTALIRLLPVPGEAWRSFQSSIDRAQRNPFRRCRQLDAAPRALD